MGMYRPLRGILLGYELVRLAGLVWAAGQVAPGGEAVFPALVYGAANALFLLMALFVRLDPVRYGAYVPLYTAGKVISVVSALGVFFVDLDRIFNPIFIDDSGILVILLLLCIALGDILSVCGALALSRKLHKLKGAEASAAAEPGAANSDDL
jgi:hypothetical protein